MRPVRSPLTTLFAIIISLAFLSQVAIAEDKVTKDGRRELSFSWGKIEGAKAYNVEIIKVDGDKETAITDPRKKVTDTGYHGFVIPGKYRFRLRTLDRRYVPGAWSEPSEFNVKCFPVKLQYPKERAKVNPLAKPRGGKPTKSGYIPIKQDKSELKEDKASVFFKWDLQKGATSYKLTVTDPDGDEIASQMVSSNTTTVKLDVAKQYKWNVIAFNDETEGDPVKKPLGFSLKGGRLAPPEVGKADPTDRAASWTTPENASHFTVYLYRKVGKKKWKKILSKKNVTETSLDIEKEWPKGKYKLKVRAHSPMRASSKYGSSTFNLPFPVRIVKGAPYPAGEVTMGYRPMYWHYSFTGPSIRKTEFDSALLNSWMFAAKWYPRFMGGELGLGTTIYRKSTTLFEDEQTGAADDNQKALPLVDKQMSLTAMIRRGTPEFGLKILTGIKRQSIFMFYSDTETTIDVQENNLTSWLLGGGFNFLLYFDVLFEGEMIWSQPFVEEPFIVEKSLAVLTTGTMSRQIWRPEYRLGFFYSYDYASYTFRNAEKAVEGDLRNTSHVVGSYISWIF